MKSYKVYAYATTEPIEDNKVEFFDRKAALNYANYLIEKFKNDFTFEFNNFHITHPQEDKLKLQVEKTADKDNYQSIQVSDINSFNVADIIFETIEK